MYLCCSRMAIRIPLLDKYSDMYAAKPCTIAFCSCIDVGMFTRPVPQETHIEQVDLSTLGTGWRFHGLRDAFARLYFIVDGQGWMKMQGVRDPLESGHLYLLPAYTPVSFGTESHITLYWLHFTTSASGGMPLTTRMGCRNRAQVDATLAIPVYERLMTLAGDQLTHSQKWECAGLLTQLLSHLVTERPPPPLDTRALARFAAVLAYIDDHIADSIGVAQLARIAGMERSYFSTAFARCFGQPPSLYMQWKRVERVQRLLVGSDLTQEAIAEQTGFYDAFHLSKTFKRLTGLTPRSYRRERTQGLP